MGKYSQTIFYGAGTPITVFWHYCYQLLQRLMVGAQFLYTKPSAVAQVTFHCWGMTDNFPRTQFKHTNSQKCIVD